MEVPLKSPNRQVHCDRVEIRESLNKIGISSVRLPISFAVAVLAKTFLETSLIRSNSDSDPFELLPPLHYDF